MSGRRPAGEPMPPYEGNGVVVRVSGNNRPQSGHGSHLRICYRAPAGAVGTSFITSLTREVVDAMLVRLNANPFGHVYWAEPCEL